MNPQTSSQPWPAATISQYSARSSGEMTKGKSAGAPEGTQMWSPPALSGAKPQKAEQPWVDECWCCAEQATSRVGRAAAAAAAPRRRRRERSVEGLGMVWGALGGGKRLCVCGVCVVCARAQCAVGMVVVGEVGRMLVEVRSEEVDGG